MIRMSDRVANEISVQSRDNVIEIRDPGLFGEDGESRRREFLQRVLQVAEVDSVEIAHRLRLATIAFRKRGTSSAAVLKKLAHALRTPARAIENAADFPFVEPEADSYRVFRQGEVLSEIKVIDVAPGRMRVRCSRKAEKNNELGWIHEALSKTHGVTSAKFGYFGQSVLVQYDPEIVDPMELAHQVAVVVARGNGSDAAGPVVVSGMTRVVYVTLAGGSFALACVGAIVPGIPTTPFVLLTSYFLARSSPTLNRMLTRSKLFGQLVRDWEEKRAINLKLKRFAMILPVIMVGATAAFTDVTQNALLMMTTFGAIGILVVSQIPAIPEEEPATEAAPPQLSIVNGVPPLAIAAG